MRFFPGFVILLTVFLLPPLPSQAASPQETRPLADMLNKWEVEEAWAAGKATLEKSPKDPQLLELVAQIAFHRGDYPEALKLMKAAIEGGGENQRRRGEVLFIEETLGILSTFKKFESPHFVIYLDEKQDGILRDYLFETLEKTYQLAAHQYGFQPREKIRVEIFPDSRTFYYATTLSVQDIEGTGAVGLTQFNKIMLLSPRALRFGYRWLDALSHEYMHYLVTRLAGNKAPVWFHEGLAKYKETEWRSGPSYLTPLYQTLLARALTGGKLIRFEKMEPSLVKLPTPEDVQLAYAQAASVIEFIFTKAGDAGLMEIMRRMGAASSSVGGDPLQDVMGLAFTDFEGKWKEFLKSKGMKAVAGAQVSPYQIKEEAVNDDPLDIEEIKSPAARNRTRLGERLQGKGRMEAAALEYKRALSDARDSVTILIRLADTLLSLNRTGEALEFLKQARGITPDRPAIYIHMGRAYLKQKDFIKAQEALQSSIQINPFDPETHQNLAAVYEMLEDKPSAAKEREIARRLMS